MQGGTGRAAPAYYVAIVVLAVALVAGATLFGLLVARGNTQVPAFAVTGPHAASCPVGSAPACFGFQVSNSGGTQGTAFCIVTAALNTTALFLNDQRSTGVLLSPNETRTIYVKVTPTKGDLASAPVMLCR